MGIVTRSDHFPEVTIIYTRVTVTITSTFEIRDKDAAETVEDCVDRAVEALRGWGGATVSYETEQVEE